LQKQVVVKEQVIKAGTRWVWEQAEEKAGGGSVGDEYLNHLAREKKNKRGAGFRKKDK